MIYHIIYIFFSHVIKIYISVIRCKNNSIFSYIKWLGKNFSSCYHFLDNLSSFRINMVKIFIQSAKKYIIFVEIRFCINNVFCFYIPNNFSSIRVYFVKKSIMCSKIYTISSFIKAKTSFYRSSNLYFIEYFSTRCFYSNYFSIISSTNDSIFF